MFKSAATVSLALIAGTMAITTASAEDWRPTRAVDLIVPSGAGGGHDNNARLLGAVLEKYAGQPINIINQPAGGGVVAYKQMRDAEADGHTIGQVSVSIVSDQFRIEGVDYNKDSYAYIGQISADQNVLVVKADGPYGDMNITQFIEAAKAEPGSVAFGVSGNWTNHDYTRYQIEQVTGASFLRVPIKGGAQIVLSLLSGDVQAGALYPSEIKAQVDAGALKPLAHNGSGPLAAWPDVPSFTSLGLKADLAIWRALVMPKETPENIRKGWEAILEKAMNDPALKEGYGNAGIGYAYRGAEDTEALVDLAETAYREISVAAGVKRASE